MTDNEVLFQYLRSILFDAKITAPEKDTLGEASLSLYEGLRFLAQCVEEYHAYANAISSGDLAANYHNNRNRFCYPLKNLQANLRHLTWQAKRVAAGDYTQEVSFLGEFSEAFNSMTRQLREREEQLKHTIVGIEQQKEALRQSNELFVALTGSIDELIVVNDVDTGEVLYTNKPDVIAEPDEVYTALLEQIQEHVAAKGGPGERTFVYDGNHTHLRIVTFAIDWNGSATYANVVHDVTADWLKTQELEESSNRDPATGLYNRRYCMACLESWIEEQTPFSLCFVDLDNLKYVNDVYGHAEGDRYIAEVAKEVSRQIRRGDVCARMGGDEFVVLFPHCPHAVAEAKMLNAAQRISATFNDENDHPRGVSYGIVEVDHTSPVTPESILIEADERMYDKKRERKVARTV